MYDTPPAEAFDEYNGTTNPTTHQTFRAARMPHSTGVIHEAPFASFDAEYSGHFNITNDGQIAETLKVKATSAVGTGGVRTIVRRLTPLECERLMGWPDNYTAHGMSDEGELVDIANTNRYRICGNGIVATVTEWIGNRLPTVTGESDDETMTNSSNRSPAATSRT